MPSNAAASSDAVPDGFVAMVSAFRATLPLVAAFIVISSATVAGAVPVMVSVTLGLKLTAPIALTISAELPEICEVAVAVVAPDVKLLIFIRSAAETAPVSLTVNPPV